MTGANPQAEAAAPLDEAYHQSRERNVLGLERDIEQDRLSQLSRVAIERLRERVVLREIIVIDSSGKAVRTPRTSLRL